MSDPTPRRAPTLAVLFLLGGTAQVAMTAPMFAAPFVAKAFALSDAQLAFVSGVISLGAFGTLAIARVSDRRGRRPVLRASFAALGPLLLATAAAPGIVLYAAAQLVATAFRGALGAIAIVAITELSDDRGRARNQGWYGFMTAFASAVPLLLAGLVGSSPHSWRVMFAVPGLAVLALPWLWPRVPETEQFYAHRARAGADGEGMLELVSPVYRRRALGLLTVGVLRGAGIGAVSFYMFHHAVSNLAMPEWQASLVVGVAGMFGNFGNATGAIWADRWGRRPTQVVGVAVTVLSGVAYYWVPAGQPSTPFALGVAFFGFVLGVQSFSVADRLLDTELFPTRLRSTYAGLRMIGDSAAGVIQNFGLSAAIAAFGSLPLAITWMVPGLVIPASALFWWATTETRGLDLEDASLEEAGGDSTMV
jgi:putative MFS transporter